MGSIYYGEDDYRMGFGERQPKKERKVKNDMPKLMVKDLMQDLEKGNRAEEVIKENISKPRVQSQNPFLSLQRSLGQSATEIFTSKHLAEAQQKIMEDIWRPGQIFNV